jgi:hypothetical protein
MGSVLEISPPTDSAQGVRANALSPRRRSRRNNAAMGPTVRLPALDHAPIVMGWRVEMHEVYSSVCSFRGEGEDQGGIWIPSLNLVEHQDWITSR